MIDAQVSVGLNEVEQAPALNVFTNGVTQGAIVAFCRNASARYSGRGVHLITVNFSSEEMAILVGFLRLYSMRNTISNLLGTPGNFRLIPN